jgi:hypothetical protein
MYFSRRKLTQPFPPFPAVTRIEASSTNFMLAVYSVVVGLAGAEGSKILKTQRL